MGEVDRGMRHAALRIAAAHGQEQKLTTMQFAIRDKYVVQSTQRVKWLQSAATAERSPRPGE